MSVTVTGYQTDNTMTITLYLVLRKSYNLI